VMWGYTIRRTVFRMHVRIISFEYYAESESSDAGKELWDW